jgi:hypothetical protein
MTMFQEVCTIINPRQQYKSSEAHSIMLARNHTTVIVTITDYTTIFPTKLPATSILDGASTLLQTSAVHTTVTEYITIFPTTLSSTPLPDAASIDTRTHTTRATSPSDTTILAPGRTSTRTSSASIPLLNSSLQASTSAITLLTPTTSTTSSGLPTGWPSPAPEQLVEKHYSNVLPILMILWLIFTALFFLGALIYFAWRLARGHCADCALKIAEIGHLKERLAGQELVTPALVRERESAQQSNKGLHAGQEVSVSERDLDGDGITFRLDDPNKGIKIKLNKKEGKVVSPSPSDRSYPFDLENAVPVRSHFSAETADEDTPSRDAGRASKLSTTSLFRNGLSMDENRALALVELERNHSLTQDSRVGETPIPFWKRGLARAGMKNTARGDAAQRNDTQNLTGQKYQPMTRIYSDSGRAPIAPALRTPQILQRTYSKPGPAPAAPARVPRRRPVTNPYAFNTKTAYFGDADDASSDRRGSDAGQKQYPQPRPAHSEFITVGLEDEETSAEAARRTAELTTKRRAGGYGEMASIVPDGMDGYGEFPVRLR